MDKIFHSTFDFFSHAIPGVIIVAAFYILEVDRHNLEDILVKANELKIGGTIAFLILGYVIGFSLYPIGRILYKKIGFSLWKKSISENINISLSKKYVLAREYSPNNFRYIELWNMFCAMSHNLATACFIIFIMVLTKSLLLLPNFPINSLIHLTVLTFLFFLFLHRAVVFSIWAADDLNATIKELELLEKRNE